MFSRIAEEYFFRILFNSKDLYKFDPSLIQNSPGSGEASPPAESPISHEYDISLFHQLLQAIHQPGKNVKKPTLYFIHPILPHSPWEYDPSGKRYPAWNSSNSSNDILCEESPSLLYCKNSSFPNELYKRHLLQVGYVDTMLGQIISKLKATQLYDRSLIMIVADHGISFMPHQSRRQISANNYADIMSIPLFIKKPGQIIGKSDERQAETVDIIPTIAEILHLPLAWHTDGRDLFMSLPADRTSHSICSPKIKMNFSATQIQAARRKALQEKFTVLHL